MLISLAGYGSRVSIWKPIIPGGHFGWYEATKFGTRLPESRRVVDNIVAMARRLEFARSLLGEPMIVTSWYRPPDINRAVGGVENSPHLAGRAVDFYCEFLSREAIYGILNPLWGGGLGTYPVTGHTHLDNFGYRRW